MIHRVFLKSSHYATNRRIQNAANQFKVDVYWGSVALGGLVEARSGIRAAWSTVPQLSTSVNREAAKTIKSKAHQAPL